MNNVIRVHCTGNRWCVGFGRGNEYGTFPDPISAINHALNVVAEALDLPVIWPESVVVA